MTNDRAALEAIKLDRDAATQRVVESDHRLRVMVAGPGTGKSYVFKLALQRKGGRGLALTFIKTLAAELAKDLGDDAATFTFHAYSKHLVHQLSPPGLTRDFSLYPPLFDLMTIDLGLLGFDVHRSEVERALQELDETTRMPGEVLVLGSYYDAASFVDLVYRVFVHLRDHPDLIPAHPLVVVDEDQDFSRLESEFIALLGLKSPLLIAGDDDQALYKFRHASAEHIRELARRADVERHELPYCSRCTGVVVEAVNMVIARAVASGHLRGRLEKPFSCYLPDKLEDSRRHPKLIDARCSIHRYVARYVEAEIQRIPQEDIEESIKGRHPTVLVVGPRQFVRPVHKHLTEGRYPQAKMRLSDQLTIELIHGYRRLARDPSSNLGWRILVHLIPFPGWEEAVRDALRSDEPLAEKLPAEYRAKLLTMAAFTQRVLAGEELGAAERVELAEALGMEPEKLEKVLMLEEASDEEASPLMAEGAMTEDTPRAPTILCTTRKGAKGLSAEHVFVVGCMNGHFPASAADPTDEEICEFLVALSRTRKACHLVSCKLFGGPPPLAPSLFLRWVSPLSAELKIDKTYWG